MCTHAQCHFFATGWLGLNNRVKTEASVFLQFNYNGTDVFPLSLQSQCFSLVYFCVTALSVLATGNYHALLTYLKPFMPTLSTVHYNYRVYNREDK